LAQKKKIEITLAGKKVKVKLSYTKIAAIIIHPYSTTFYETAVFVFLWMFITT
jgi:hypothetical protein